MDISSNPHKQYTGCRSAAAFRRSGGWLVIVLALLFFLAPALPLPAAAQSGDALPILQKKYDLAKAYYHNLEANRRLGRSRVRWEQDIGKFRQVYLAAPKDELGLQSLFMMGRIYHEMFSRFHHAQDLEEAMGYFDDVSLLFPTSRLADDAMYSLGRIYLDEKEDRQRAGEIFYQITCQYPQSDMARRADDELHNLNFGGRDSTAEVPMPPAPQDGGQVQVLPVKFWSTDDYTRVVVQTTAPVIFKEQLIEKDASRPRRLYIDFKHCRIPPAACTPVPIQDGLLKRVRAGQFSPDTVRIVLDIESITSYKIFTLQDPFRAIIDVMGGPSKQQAPAPEVPVITAGTRNARAKEAVGKTEADQSAPSLAKQLGLGIRRIVIDPGHGGKDPGAIAANGLKEKDVVLAVAKMLADQLRQKLFCEVILTRTRDVFIPLEERTAIANTERGDLFISIHVNSAPSPRVKGVETYVLNLTNSEEAMRLAAFENATSASNMSDLQNILADLMNNSKLDESTKLAEHVQTNMAQGLRLKNLGVKQAPFYVLIGAQMPAILSEVTFISNPAEANHLRDKQYLAAIAEQLSTGITEYVSDTSLAMVVDRRR